MEKHIDQLGIIPEFNGMKSVNLVMNDNFEKVASSFMYTYSEEMIDAIEKYKEEIPDNEILATVIGLGAGEFYGPNINADWFSHETLMRIYKTFEDGLLYQHHINKDPALSLGTIKFATYNPKMRRVELLIAPDRNKASEWVNAIERGEAVDVSFGYRTSYDRCSICKQKSANRNEYCLHLKNQMNEILPDGRQVYAINPDTGKFFELSFVRKGAVSFAKIMQKVAYDKRTLFVGASAQPEQIITKVATVKSSHEKVATEVKLAELIKNVEHNMTQSGVDPKLLKTIGMTTHVFNEGNKKEITPEIVKDFKGEEILGTLPLMGIMLKFKELVSIFSDRVEELNCLVSNLKEGNYNYHEDYEADVDDLYGDTTRFRFSPKLFNRLSSDGFMDKRSLFTPSLFNLLLNTDNYDDLLEDREDFDKKAAIVETITDPAMLATGALGYLYSKYLGTVTPTKLSGLSKSVAKNPMLLPAILLGIGIAGNVIREENPDVETEYMYNRDRINGDNLIKMSQDMDKLSGVIKNIIAPFGVGILGSSYNEVKRRQGYDQGTIGNFWADHPFMSAAILAVGGNKLGKLMRTPKATGALTKYKDQFLKMMAPKTASVLGMLPSLAYKSGSKFTSMPMSLQLGGLGLDLFVISQIAKALAGKDKVNETVKQLKNKGYNKIQIEMSGEE